MVLVIAACVIIPMGIYGCKGRVEKAAEEPGMEMAETSQVAVSEQDTALAVQAPEPAQNVAVETIPPSATAPMEHKTVSAAQEKPNRNKDIQLALKNAGFYAGTVDGKIGPKSKKAIIEFQKAKGLKPDGKIGPKTWAELEKYLGQQ